MDNLVYEDKPRWTLLFPSWSSSVVSSVLMINFIMTAIFVLLIVVVTQVRQEEIRSIAILAAVFLIVFIWVRTLATKYQIFNDRIRIVLTWIFHFDVPFSSVDNVREGTLKDLRGVKLNFIPYYPGDDVVQINRKRGAKINITPSNRKLFLENLNKAMGEWRKYNISY